MADTPLDHLIAAVEAGEISTDLIRDALDDDPPRCMWCLAAKNAIAAAWQDFLARAGLQHQIEGQGNE